MRIRAQLPDAASVCCAGQGEQSQSLQAIQEAEQAKSQGTRAFHNTVVTTPALEANIPANIGYTATSGRDGCGSGNTELTLLCPKLATIRSTKRQPLLREDVESPISDQRQTKQKKARSDLP
ncbi:hypothetical protein FDECE_6208 [Fusarium decemcellulare]|nr:hypothetical protein FDECE_6208 [Fusarium decemcellulare]